MPPAPVSDTTQRTRWDRQLWALGPVVVIALAIRFSGADATDDEWVLVAYAPWIKNGLTLTALAWFVSLAVARAWTRGRRGPSALALVVALMLGFPVVVMGTFLRGSTMWRDCGTVPQNADAADASPADPVWGAFRKGFMDYDVAFVRLLSRGLVVTRWEIVAIAPDDGDVVPVVRPEALREARGLVLRNGCLALISDDGGAGRGVVCNVAIREDGAPIHPLVWPRGGASDPRLPSEDPSPFFLVEPGDELHAADVDRLATAIAAAAADPTPSLDGLPTDAALVRALGSDDAGIRAAAARLVRAGGATLYPIATSRL